MHSRQRYVILGIMGLSALVAAVLVHALGWAWGLAGIADPSLGGIAELSVTHLLGWGTGLAAGAIVLRVPRTRALAAEVVDELARVSWPARDETAHATLVVIVTVVVCSTYLGVLDALLLSMTDLVLGVHGSTAG